MLAMQYTIQLPEDFDMEAIRARVKERIPLFNQLPGLVHKAYLASFEDKIYAPLYLWNDITELRNFLLDDLFHGVTTSFRRPRVRSWSVLNMQRGSSVETPTYAVRESDPIPAEANLTEWVESERKKQAELANKEGLYSHVLGLDPDRWEILRYSLWASEKHAITPESDCFQTYTVLHV